MLRLLAAILGAHIERDDLPPAAYVWPDEQPVAQAVIDRVDSIRRHVAVAADLAVPRVDIGQTSRPCWACGDPAGFHAFHLPCWKVAGARLPNAPWERTES
jgi:hypothetical protein